jgi:hypothetical protein
MARARLTDVQLASVLARLAEPLTPDGEPNDVPEAERARVAVYAVAEKEARRAAPPCPPDDVVEAVHAAAYELEHEGNAAAVARASLLVRAPLDETTRSLLARLAHAATEDDPTATTEAVRNELADWRCMGEEKHRRFHERLAR